MPEREHWVPHHMQGGLEEGLVKVPSQEYRDGWDRIFGQRSTEPLPEPPPAPIFNRDGITPPASPAYLANYDRVFGSERSNDPKPDRFHTMTARDGTEVRLLCVEDCPVCRGG